MEEFCLVHLDFWWSDVDSFPETEACSHFWGLHSIGKFPSHDTKSRTCVTQLWFIWLESFHFQLASIRFPLHLSITKANQLIYYNQLSSTFDIFDKISIRGIFCIKVTQLLAPIFNCLGSWDVFELKFSPKNWSDCALSKDLFVIVGCTHLLDEHAWMSKLSKQRFWRLDSLTSRTWESCALKKLQTIELSGTGRA